MPPIFVYEDPDGVLESADGVTRATRMAKQAPGVTVSPRTWISPTSRSSAATARPSSVTTRSWTAMKGRPVLAR